MLEPLTAKEYSKLRKLNFSTRQNLSYVEHYALIADSIISGKLKFRKTPLHIYDVGVGMGKGIIELSRQLREKGIAHYIHAADYEDGLLYHLRLHFQVNECAKLELLLGDFTQRKLEPIGNITIGININASSYNLYSGYNSNAGIFDHIAFDNLVRATVAGGYLVTNIVDTPVNEASYGLKYVPMCLPHPNVNAFRIYRKIKEKGVFDFPMRKFRSIA